MRDLEAHERSIMIALLALVAFDLSETISHVGVWVYLDFVDVRVAVIATLVRIPTWGLYALAQLRGVRTSLRRAEAADDPELLAAHTTLARFARRVSAAYVLTWLACDGAWMLLARAGVPVELPFGNAELLAAVMIASTMIVTPVVVMPMLDHLLDGVLAAIQTQIVARGLPLRRARASIESAVIRLGLAASLAVLVGVFGIAIAWRIDGVRSTSVEVQLRRAEVSAARLAGGVGEPLDGVEIVGPEQIPSALARALEHESTAATHDPRSGVTRAAASLADGRYALATGTPDEQLPMIVGFVLGLFATVATIVGFGSWAYGRTLAAPIERFTETARRFTAHGELGELARVIAVRDDEVGRLSVNFNAMLDTLEQLTRVAEAVAAGDLRVEIEQPGQLHDAFRGMLARLNEIVARLRETSLELASAAAEIHALMREQELAAQQQATGVQQVSQTVGSLATSAQNIADTAKAVLVDAEHGVATTDAMADKITALRAHAASVTALLDVIREVAERSDLLALNGSLEATRVGEAGRGFALVAVEMRRLAERVTNTVADVREQVTNIESSGSATVVATEENRKLAQQTAEAARQISAVTARQSAETEEASIGVERLAAVVVAAATAVSQTRGAAEGLRIHAVELERLIGTFAVRDDLV